MDRTNLPTSTWTEAFIDPVFSFNQEAFDEAARTQGFASFDLGQYYAFRFSPGIGPDVPADPVPEPVLSVLRYSGWGRLPSVNPALSNGHGAEAAIDAQQSPGDKR
jgi:hypothetical protein